MISMTTELNAKYILFRKISFITYCFLIGVALVVFSILDYPVQEVNLGILFILTAAFHYIEFEKHIKIPAARYIYAALAVIGVVLGFVSIFYEPLELWTVCLIFGIMDTASGLIEIFTNAVILDKTFKNPISFVEFAISIADIFFGIILIIKLEAGLLVHILYIAAVFFINGIIAIIELIHHKRKHEQKSIDSH